MEEYSRSIPSLKSNSFFGGYIGYISFRNFCPVSHLNHSESVWMTSLSPEKFGKVYELHYFRAEGYELLNSQRKNWKNRSGGIDIHIDFFQYSNYFRGCNNCT